MTPSITYVAVYSDMHGAVTIASTLPPDTLDRRRLTSGEVLVQGFLQFAAKNGISTTANARHVSALQAALNLSSFDDLPAAQAAPEGWVLVPAKPTREWIGAVADDGYADCDAAQLIASILSHAPAAPVTVAGPSVWGFRFPTGGRWHYTEHGPNDRFREELIWRPFYEAPQPAIQQGDDATALNEIADIFLIGSEARKDRRCILENVSNSFRRSQCLSRIEHGYFTVPHPPEGGDEEDEGGEECLLNWGDEPDDYAKRFGEALAQMAALAPAAQGDACLWCVHVQGHDGVYAMPSRAAALERANKLNELFGRHPHEEGDPIMRAVVIEWPHSADSHKQDIGAPHAF